MLFMLKDKLDLKLEMSRRVMLVGGVLERNYLVGEVLERNYVVKD